MDALIVDHNSQTLSPIKSLWSQVCMECSACYATIPGGFQWLDYHDFLDSFLPSLRIKIIIIVSEQDK